MKTVHHGVHATMGLTVEFQHVLADKKTGRLSFRRVYPPELRPFIPGSPVELKRSLGGTSLHNLVVRQRYEAAARLWAQTVEKADKIASQRFDKPTISQVAHLAGVFERDWHQSEVNTLEARGAGYADAVLAGWEERLSDFKHWKIDRDFDEIVSQWGASARDLFEAAGIMIAPDDRQSIEALSSALNDKAIALSASSIRRMKGDIVEVPALAAFEEQAPEPPPRRVRHEESFEAIAQALLNSTRHNISVSTAQASATALRFFREAFGPLPPRKITKALVTEWLDLLSYRPAKLPVDERSVPLRELVQRYEGRKDVPRLTPKTLSSLLGMLCALWNKAQQEEGKIEEDIANPFAARRSLASHRPDDPIELSTEELNAIFRLPVFTIGERPKRGKGEAAYWIPLLLLWTGARPEEIAQLIVSDIFQDPDDPTGRWLLRITDEGVHPHKGRRGLKTTKVQSGRRAFPIPQPLLDLNLLDYVEHLRALRETALFPALRTKGASKLLFPGWGEWWSKYLQEKGVLPSNAKRRAAREFRHTWTTAARRCKVPEDAREYIQGHRGSGKSANVLYGSQSPLGARMNDVSFVGLDLSHVKPWKP